MNQIGQVFYAFVAATDAAVAVWEASRGEWVWAALNTGLAVLITLVLFIELAHMRKDGR